MVEFLKFSLKGVIMAQNAILGSFSPVSMSQAYSSQVTFFDLAKPSVY